MNFMSILRITVLRIGESIIPVGIEGMKQHMIEVRKTYPDLKMTIIRQYTDGDTVISELNTFEALFEKRIIKPA